MRIKMPKLPFAVSSQGLLLIVLAFTLIRCSSTKTLDKTELSVLKKQVESSSKFQSGFTGFVLIDPQDGKTLYAFNGDKYFTPASNTKLFTYFTCRQLLTDSIPGLRYVTKGDSLIFWGTGDPSFLHPAMKSPSRVYDFLKSRQEKLFFCPNNFQDMRFGEGWMWDDYQASFQPEKAPFPVYGNVVRFKRSASDRMLSIKPGYFFAYAGLDANMGGSTPNVRRSLEGNDFRYNPQAVTGEPFEQEIPFDYDPQLIASLLADTLGKAVQILDVKVLPPTESRTIYSVPVDTLYKLLLQESDNFIAEQLLYICSDRKFGLLNTQQIIGWAKDSLFRQLPQPLKWFDGSGLSRYNLITPYSIASLLHQIYQATPNDRLRATFPTGGVSGTIKEWYGGNPPYVFAKSGTLANVHCLSGYLKTNAGKMLAFSFMHNNSSMDGKEVKLELERILQWIRDNY